MWAKKKLWARKTSNPALRPSAFVGSSKRQQQIAKPQQYTHFMGDRDVKTYGDERGAMGVIPINLVAAMRRAFVTARVSNRTPRTREKRSEQGKEKVCRHRIGKKAKPDRIPGMRQVVSGGGGRGWEEIPTRRSERQCPSTRFIRCILPLAHIIPPPPSRQTQQRVFPPSALSMAFLPFVCNIWHLPVLHNQNPRHRLGPLGDAGQVTKHSSEIQANLDYRVHSIV
jgi:hypothetical protein